MKAIKSMLAIVLAFAIGAGITAASASSEKVVYKESVECLIAKKKLEHNERKHQETVYDMFNRYLKEKQKVTDFNNCIDKLEGLTGSKAASGMLRCISESNIRN